MSDTNKTYRIKADVLNEQSIMLNLTQDYDSFDVLSLNISQTDLYKLHSADYGVIVGRVVANGNFGIPNAKISIFIPRDAEFNVTTEIESIYPYIVSSAKNSKNVRYNLLPDNQVADCHQIVGTFPNKTYLLANDVLMDVFDKYYRFTCRTNNSGDYVICGVPVGNHTIHMDLDLSDCGILSQRPRDFVYKGYTIEQFENPNKFKSGTDYENLSQVFTQDQVVNVIPFWGNTEEGDEIGITRADMSIAFEFKPTCVFIGSVVSDNASNGISRKCVPTNTMGAMDELVTGEGTIEMIRKTPGGSVEEFQIKGRQLINENGVWCYQIPMNLDYMMTDEYGNMVPTDDPSKGIPTRTRVRFRISMQDNEENTDNYFRCKVLVPNRNGLGDNGNGPDYDFGTNTRDESFRDLFWNYVYTVKSYIPRIQKSSQVKTERFSAIKHCNIYGNNNPMPYNNIRIKIPFMFTLLCSLIKTYVRIIYYVNIVIAFLFYLLGKMHPLFRGSGKSILGKLEFRPRWVELKKFMTSTTFITIGDSLCPEMEGWYFAPVSNVAYNLSKEVQYGDEDDGSETANLFQNTFDSLTGKQDTTYVDETSVDQTNNDDTDDNICLTRDIDYLLSCIEMNLAQEYRVISFDFYNDWLNGVIYIPRFMRYIKPKRTYLWGAIKRKEKVRGCMSDSSIFSSGRKYYQQCALKYAVDNDGGVTVNQDAGCNDGNGRKKKQKCHTRKGSTYTTIFGKRGGLVEDKKTIIGESVYYLKPYDTASPTIRLNENGDGTYSFAWGYDNYIYLFATDIVLLGSLNECDSNGLPQLFKYLPSSTYLMPTNLALTTLNDEAYIYTTSGGTMCQGKNYDPDNGVSVADQTYEAERLATESSSDSIDLNQGDDAIAVTEAAGISWNYTGPDQAYSSTTLSMIFNPGGHFLGLSCRESETNIKSCVNLQRICEMGASLSHRKEIVRKVTSTGFEYGYIVPNGIISEDEIIAPDPRAMFATMNHHVLVADERTNEVGYPIYSFEYIRGNRFDGSLKRNVRTADFNRKIDNIVVNDGGTGNTDYDADESDNTYMRALEYGNIDYIKFRFGEEKPSKIRQRFAINGRLPQFENSFYFFFGLRNGSTALDEFNKQFFSECEDNILYREPRLIITTDFNVNEGGIINVSVVHLGDSTSEYKYEIINEDGAPAVNPIITSDTSHRFIQVTPGTYKVVVTEQTNMTYLEGQASVAMNFIQMDIEAVEAFTSDMSVFNASVNTYRGRTGGYILLDDNITIDGADYTVNSITTSQIKVKSGGTVANAYTIGLTGVSAYLTFTDENGMKKHMLFMNNNKKITMNLTVGNATFDIYTHKFRDNSEYKIDFGDGLIYRNNNTPGSYSGLTFNDWTVTN